MKDLTRFTELLKKVNKELPGEEITAIGHDGERLRVIELIPGLGYDLKLVCTDVDDKVVEIDTFYNIGWSAHHGNAPYPINVVTTAQVSSDLMLFMNDLATRD